MYFPIAVPPEWGASVPHDAIDHVELRSWYCISSMDNRDSIAVYQWCWEIDGYWIEDR